MSPVADDAAIVGGKGVNYRFTMLTDGLIRYEYSPDGEFEDRASTFAINRKQPVPKFRVVELEDGGMEIVTERMRLTYDKKEFTTNGLSIAVLGNISDWHSVWRYGQSCGDLGGTARTLDEADGRIPLLPGVLSRNGYAGVEDSDTMLFEDDGWVGVRKPGKRIDGYIFAYGHDFRECLKAFFEISGKPPLLPRWSFGNWWSRYYAYSEKQYIELMDKFKEEGVPLSVGVIDMDWHHVEKVDPKHGSGWTGYSWNKELFPDPKRFTKQLHDRNIKLTLNVHPADGIRSFEDAYEPLAKAIGHDTKDEDPIAFDVTNKKFLDGYFDIVHRNIEDDGCDFWWVDWQQGPYSKVAGIDPLWVLNHYHFLDNARDGTRALTFSRYAGPGSHRYPVGFSGDTVVTWESLDFQPEFTATASNVGYGWWSHDIGGHMCGYKNDELATRWVQLGCFSPILRLHSSNNPFNSKEPWTFNAAACKAQIAALQYRHRLIPYLYTMNYLSARDGAPLVQPMYYDYPTLGGYPGYAYEVPNQFLFGTSLMVAPITSPLSSITQLASTKAWLPPTGRFVDIFTSAVYDGDCHVKLHRTLDGYPVLAKEGSIIPLDGPLSPPNECGNPTSLELLVAVGADGKFDLIEDDGTGSSISDVKSTTTPITFSQESGTLTIGPSSASGPERTWKIRFLASSTKPTGITIDSKEQAVKSSASRSDLDTVVEVVLSAESKAIIELGKNPQLTATDVKKFVFPIMDMAQVDYNAKSALWNQITGKGSKNVKVSRILASPLPEEFKNAILEYVLADERSVF